MRGIITICGSTSFKDQFAEVNSELTKADWAVFSVGTFVRAEYHDPDNPKAVTLKVQLDALHKAKIAMSQAIVVVNVGGYAGDSTKSEIEYAEKLGKLIYWYDPREGALYFLRPNDRQAVPQWSKGRDWKDLLPNGGGGGV
jgi:hypothetical protein